VLEQGAGLWQLLAAIALNKLHRQVRQHSAARRAMNREQALDSVLEETIVGRLRSRQPATAAESAAIAEVYAGFLSKLTELERRVLQDRTQAEIAQLVQRSERTIRRILADLQGRLENELLDLSAPGERGGVSPPVLTAQDVGDDSERDALSDGQPNRPAYAGRSPDNSAIGTEWLSDHDFLLLRLIGAGGTGKVYEAVRRDSNELVAVKILKKRSQTDPEAVRRFLGEAVVVSRLTHPGIVPIRGVGSTRTGGYFLVYEYHADGDLATWCRGRTVSIADALRWICEAAQALRCAHQQQVIHCDLKPSNLLLDGEGSVHVTDFGLSHVIGSVEQRRVAGTIGYMAPEQLDPCRGSIGPPTDVFGLGAVLFALLTGQPPFLGATWETTIDALFHADIPSLQARSPDVPPELDRLCRRCLSRDPAERFLSLEELLSHVRAVWPSCSGEQPNSTINQPEISRQGDAS
jgi:eukaryotic-like serine/threonine-protein kinase